MPFSPAQNCAICLEPVAHNTKCFAYSCFHEFCYGCLTTWLEHKKECPLCKRPLKQVIYDIKSPRTYKTVNVVNNNDDSESDASDVDGLDVLEVARRIANYNDMPRLRALFGYRSASIDAFVRYNGVHDDSPIPERTTVFQWRCFCYQHHLFAVPSDPPRMRHTLQFYRRNAGHLNELKNWLSREMHTLSFVIDAAITPLQIDHIMRGVEQCDINSAEFQVYVPMLEPKRQHFMHELVSFATSMHNHSVREYDANVKYDFRNPIDGAENRNNRVNAVDTSSNETNSDDSTDDDQTNTEGDQTNNHSSFVDFETTDLDLDEADNDLSPSSSSSSERLQCDPNIEILSESDQGDSQVFAIESSDSETLSETQSDIFEEAFEITRDGNDEEMTFELWDESMPPESP